MTNLTAKTYQFKAGFGEPEILKMREGVARQMHEAGISGPSSYTLINVLDEFCCNIMEYGASHWLEISVEPGPKDIHAILKDDGVAFDPTENIRQMDPEQPAKTSERRLGLYMVALLASDVQYQREGGINHLEFRVRR